MPVCLVGLQPPFHFQTIWMFPSRSIGPSHGDSTRGPTRDKPVQVFPKVEIGPAAPTDGRDESPHLQVADCRRRLVAEIPGRLRRREVRRSLLASAAHVFNADSAGRSPPSDDPALA